MRFLLGVLMLMISGSALATIDVLQFKDEAQEQQFRQLTEELRCPKCQSVQTYVYEAANGEGENTETRPVEKVNKTKPVQKNFNICRGCLVQKRGHFRSDRIFELAGKETIVGRQDTDAPCDVMVDDPTMSRRSISITAETKSAGIIYKLTVLNATNKVKHNGRALSAGMGEYLEFGDTIVLGRTTFKFEKAPNQES